MSPRRLALALFAAALALPLAANAQITTTRHNFAAATATWNATGQICKPCHTPHNAVTGLAAPLWNHTTSAASYTMYANPTGTQESYVPGATVGGVSLLCLSCHDGSVALENFGGNTATTSTTMGSIAPTRNLGTDLSNDHPISITYDNALVGSDNELYLPTAAVANGVQLFNSRVECASCHDPHGTTNSYLLRVPITASSLCLTCHNK